MSYLIGQLENFKDFYESFIDLAEEAMNFLRRNNPELYLKQGEKLENLLIDVYKNKILKNQSDYTIDNLYLSLDTYNQLVKYVKKERIL
jgi:hypothetical protein